MFKYLDPAENFQEQQRGERLIKRYHNYEFNKIQALGNSIGQTGQDIQQIQSLQKKGMEEPH